MVLEARVVYMLLPLLHQVLPHYDGNCCRTMPFVKECGVRDLLTEITKICLSVVKSILPQWNMITMNLQTSLNVMLFILTPVGHRMYWHGDSVWHGRHGVTCLGIFSLIKPATMVKLIFPTQIHSHVVIFYTSLYSLYWSNKQWLCVIHYISSQGEQCIHLHDTKGRVYTHTLLTERGSVINDTYPSFIAFFTPSGIYLLVSRHIEHVTGLGRPWSAKRCSHCVNGALLCPDLKSIPISWTCVRVCWVPSHSGIESD